MKVRIVRVDKKWFIEELTEEFSAQWVRWAMAPLTSSSECIKAVVRETLARNLTQYEYDIIT